MADPLLSLRHSLTQSYHRPTTSETPSEDMETDLAAATHLQLLSPSTTAPDVFPLTTLTRFETTDGPFSLQSIYFAWLRRELSIPDYITAVSELNNSLRDRGRQSIAHLPFAEKADLIAWLDGADDSEYITPLPASASQVAGAASLAAGTGATGASTLLSSASALHDHQLSAIYRCERTTGDRNTILRGIKPTDFSHIRKHADLFLKTRAAAKPSHPSSLPLAPSSKPRPAPSTKRQDPIILVSPSASSILRMSNIKPFLESGVYHPPESSTAASNLLHLTRLLPSIDPVRPFRFILVDSPDQFRPDYWNRVVAVFTTGQNWQFKGYKWPQPAELFARVHGVYVGWDGEPVPQGVLDYASGVQRVQLQRWLDVKPRKDEPPESVARRRAEVEAARQWSDRERSELVWKELEAGMMRRGWGKGGLGGAR